jgi:hypothetical protein
MPSDLATGKDAGRPGLDGMGAALIEPSARSTFLPHFHAGRSAEKSQRLAFAHGVI